MKHTQGSWSRLFTRHSALVGAALRRSLGALPLHCVNPYQRVDLGTSILIAHGSWLRRACACAQWRSLKMPMRRLFLRAAASVEAPGTGRGARARREKSAGPANNARRLRS